MFEIVYMVLDWYDGPRRGIADYRGRPHLFESEWPEHIEAESFLLLPIDDGVFELAIEEWAIWRRWEAAFYQGKASPDTHPALPEDQDRHQELERLLKGQLVIDPLRAVRRGAEFRAPDDSKWSSYGVRPLEVRWIDPP